MLDIGWTEMLVIAVVAIVVVGPKDLPRLMRTVGGYVTKVRRVAGDFQKQLNDAVRESELDDIRKEVAQVGMTGDKMAADMSKNMRVAAAPGTAPIKAIPAATPAVAAAGAAATGTPAAAVTMPLLETAGAEAGIGMVTPAAGVAQAAVAEAPKPSGILSYASLSDNDRALLAYDADDPYSGDFLSRVIEPPKPPPPPPAPEPEVAEATAETETVEEVAEADIKDDADAPAADATPAVRSAMNGAMKAEPAADLGART